MWALVAGLAALILLVAGILAWLLLGAGAGSRAETVLATCDDEVSTSGAAILLSDGRSINLDTGPDMEFADTLLLDCLLRETGAPSAVEARIGSTRALDGTQESSWENWSAFWNYHPDSGLDVTFTQD